MIETKNAIIEIATNVRQSYITWFKAELERINREVVIPLNKNLPDSKHKYSLCTEEETDENHYVFREELDNMVCCAKHLIETLNNNVTNVNFFFQYPKYRLDILLKFDRKIIHYFLVSQSDCDARTQKNKLNKNTFQQKIFKINSTLIVIYPFTWDFCEVFFEPDMEPYLGVFVLWFQKWYKRDIDYAPFKNAVHFFDCIFKDEKRECVSLYLDFGTAPPEAFYDLFFCMSKEGVDKITINKPL